jgi:hypothetical protein
MAMPAEAKEKATERDTTMLMNINKREPRSLLLVRTPPRRNSGMIPPPMISLTGHRRYTMLNTKAAALDGNSSGEKRYVCTMVASF